MTVVSWYLEFVGVHLPVWIQHFLVAFGVEVLRIQEEAVHVEENVADGAEHGAECPNCVQSCSLHNIVFSSRNGLIFVCLYL